MKSSEKILMTKKDFPSWVNVNDIMLHHIKSNSENLLPWFFLSQEQCTYINKYVAEGYPSRKLFVFAKREDGDEVACIDQSKPNRLVIINLGEIPGYEDQAEFYTYIDWYNHALRSEYGNHSLTNVPGVDPETYEEIIFDIDFEGLCKDLNGELEELSPTEISKSLSHALRHEPWVYELEMDAQGWVVLEDLLHVFRRTSFAWVNVHQDTIQKIIDSSEKKRFEIRDAKIRALYGHSFPNKIAYTADVPPDILYHGTTMHARDSIKYSSLKSMSRQYVHLSTNKIIANEVAKRKGKNIVILQIDAKSAHENGVKFYLGNEKVWLADFIPTEYIEFS